MYTAIYPEKRGFVPYDRDQYLLYLNEQAVTYTPEEVIEGEEVSERTPIKGFSYTGELEDGGTLIKATFATYDAFVAGLIRKQYSADEVEALNSNMILAMRESENERAEEFTQRWEEFQSYREDCKEKARAVLNL